MSVDAVLWRALAVLRVATLVYAGVLVATNVDEYDRPRLAVAVLAGMAVWTAAVVALVYLDERRRVPLWLGLDMVLTIAALMATLAVESSARIADDAPTLTTTWAAGPVVAWAIRGGWRWGVAGGVVVAVATVAERGALPPPTFNSVVLALLLGGVVGYLGELARAAEHSLARAVQQEAATAERERLARSIHDGVLQVLALVQRRSGDGDLARLAGEQEAALRALVSVPAVPAGDGTVDLRSLLLPAPRAAVTVSVPSTPVLLPAGVARELAAAVGAALDNVAVHVGPDAPAWVLVEDEGSRVLVTVRDEGPGVTDDRLATAAAEGRLGVAQSMRGRVRDLGGTTTLTSTPGHGTEVEFDVPR